MRRIALTWILTLLLLPALAGVGFAGSTAEESSSAAVMESTEMGGYSESPVLAAMVASGDLPPVDERLPAEPLVQDVVDRIGTYGGTFRGFQLGDADKWVLYKTGLYGGLISRSYIDLGTITPNGLDGWGPGIAKSWEWDDDAAGITVVLREGVKWSDGEPLGVHDIMFMWNEVQMNEGFQPTVPARYKVNGETMEVIQIDDHTIRFEFAGPNPWFLNVLYGATRSEYGALLAPSHYFKQFHPDHTSGKTWEDFQSEYGPVNTNIPTHTAYKLTKYNPAEEAVMERNPYYWKVDTAGNQLPYIDKMRFQMLADQEAAILRGIAGEVDLAERNFQVLENLPMLKASEADGNYELRVGIGDNFTTGNEIWLNYDLKDEAYGQLRELLRTIKFRNALSVALNREAINDLLFLGLAKEANLGISTASPYWDGEMATIAQINAEYDPDKARQLLGELGLKDQSGDGMLQYEDGGNVTFLLGAASEITAHVNLAEMVVADWKAVGIDARLHLQTRSLMFSGIRDLQFHAVTFGTTDLLFPQFRLNEGPIMPGYQSPLFVEDPPEDLQKIWDLTDEIITTVDADRVSILMKEHQRLRAENNLGIWAAHDVPLMVIVHNRLQNVPTADEIVIDNADHIPLMPDQWFIQE